MLKLKLEVVYEAGEYQSNMNMTFTNIFVLYYTDIDWGLGQH